MNDEKKKNSRTTLYIILILLLLGLNAWLFYNAYQNKEEKRRTEQRITEADSLNRELESQYNAVMNELNQQKGESAEKDSLIAQLQSQLTAQKNEIADMLKSKNYLSKKETEAKNLLADAKKQIDELKNERDAYIAKLDSVTQAYNNLVGEYDSLEIQYGTQVETNVSLSKQKDSIAGLGEIIAAKNISVTGVRSKSSGKELDEQNAKKTDRLKICFDLVNNRLAAGKKQTIMVKIIDPNGLTLSDVNSGSGEFANKDNGENSKYTTAVTIDYTGEANKNYCVYWNQQTEFIPGNYKVELYHNGYQVGSNTFTLKKPIL